jgi:hypothetical protein
MQRQAKESRRETSLSFMSRGRDRDNEPIDGSCVEPAPEEDDAETELLRELAREVDRARSARPAPEAPAEETRLHADPLLQFFLDGAPEPAIRRSVHLRVPDVEIDDLVEELATTAAALRARRAA